MLKRALILAIFAALPASLLASTATAKERAPTTHHHKHKHGHKHVKKPQKKPAAPAKQPAEAAAPTAPAEERAPVEVAKPETEVPFAGAWHGRFSGNSTGNLKVVVTEGGLAKVHCVVDGSRTEFDLTGPVAQSGEVSAVEKSFGPAGIKVHFKGMLTHKGTASGTWENPFFNLKGTWEAKRLTPQ